MFTYAALIFDLDDTLISFHQAEVYGLTQLHERFYNKVNDFESLVQFYRPINQQLWKDVANGKRQPSEVAVLRFERLAHALGLIVDAEAVSAAYEYYISKAVYWYEGAEAAWHELANAYRVGIITNGLSMAQKRKIKLMQIASDCEFILISEEEGLAKPDVSLFNKALDVLQLPASDCLMVGDSLISDYQGAINSNMDFCWISHGKVLPDHWPKPAYVIDSICSLPRLLIDVLV